ncbi:hypothetical protein ACVILH_005456 [Bradyrhizobium sp. USDA 4353]
MPRLVPGIHVGLSMPDDVDGRDKPGHEDAARDEHKTTIFNAIAAARGERRSKARFAARASKLLYARLDGLTCTIAHKQRERGRPPGLPRSPSSHGLAVAGFSDRALVNSSCHVIWCSIRACAWPASGNAVVAISRLTANARKQAPSSSSAARSELNEPVRDFRCWRADAQNGITDMLETFWSETLMKCSRDSIANAGPQPFVPPAFKIADGRKLAPADLNRS